MIWPLLLLVQSTIASPFPTASSASFPPATIRPLYQFPNETWVENIAVRSNGQLLVTILEHPQVYQVDPFNPNANLKPVCEFPNALATLGITEIEEDVFAVVTGNVSISKALLQPGSFSLWKADLRNMKYGYGGGPEQASISKITDIPAAQFLNGATTTASPAGSSSGGGWGNSHGHEYGSKSKSKGRGTNYVLISDSIKGVIYRVNLRTSKFDIVLDDPVLKPLKPLLEGGFGANGVHTRDGYLYFTNSNVGFFRVPIREDGTPSGKIKKLDDFVPTDDFTFGPNGDVYMASGMVDVFGRVPRGGTETPLKFTNRDGKALVQGNTAAQFGRTRKDAQTLYVTTNGGQTGNVTRIEGGRVLAFDFGGRHS